MKNMLSTSTDNPISSQYNKQLPQMLSENMLQEMKMSHGAHQAGSANF